MTAGRGPRHAGRKGGAPVRKSITTRYFYSTAVLLICSIAVMGFIQMYLAMGYFREENGTALIQTIDNAILAMQEAADDGIVEKRAEAAEAAGLDVEDIKRGITLTARAAGKSIRLPFFVEGMTVGAISGVLATVVVGGAYYGLEQALLQPEALWLNEFTKCMWPFMDIIWPLLGGFVLFGVAIGGVGCASSIRKHLKV